MRNRSMQYIKDTLEPTYNFTKEHFYSPIMKINLAHILMLKKQLILDKDEANRLLTATYQLYQNGYTKSYDKTYEDLFFMIEADLAKEVGDELVGNMHIAFSRNDMDTTMFRMFWREQLLEWMTAINGLRKTLLMLIQEHKKTVMPAHTHNQQAQPTTLAHYLMAVEQNLSRDIERGKGLFERINQSPMGSAALATTGFNIDRSFMARSLGFDKVMENSYDAISASDFMLEIASVLSISLSSLSRFVFDLIFMATNEVNTLYLHDKHVQTSSIMPQKRNPSALEHTRASLSKAIGELQGCFPLAHNVPLGDIVDIGDDIQPVLFSGMNRTKDILAILNEILQDGTFNKKLLFLRAQTGFSTVTELSDVLVRNYQVSFRNAHKIVGGFVRELTDQGLCLTDSCVERLNEIAKDRFNLLIKVTDTDFQNAIDAFKFVEVRDIIGGPSPIEMDRQRLNASQNVTEADNWIAVSSRQIFESYEYLRREVENCVRNLSN